MQLPLVYNFGFELVIYTRESDKISYILRTNKQNKSINCSNIIKSAQEVINGRGGGRPDMAQGSGNLDNADQFLNLVQKNLKEL